MAAKNKSKFTPDEIRKALEVLADVGHNNGYAYEEVLELLPPDERPPTVCQGSVSVRITEIGVSNSIPYSQADWKKIKTAVLTDWVPFTVDLGKRGTIHVAVDKDEEHVLDWW